MKRALITGITGQDGSYLAELLLSKGYEVHGIIRRSSTFNTGRIDHIYQEPDTPNARLILHYGDLSSTEWILNLLYNLAPDEIYNLAAQSHVKVSFEIPEYTGDITGLATTRLLEAIRCSGIKARFYQASSSEMFGATPPPQNENAVFQPRSPYGAAKLHSYWVTRIYREGYALFACNGILFNHESPRRGETFVTRKITRGLARILAGRQDKIVLGNPQGQRDWGYAPEYVEAMWLMLQQERPDDFVIGTGESHSVQEFVEEAFRYAGLDCRDFVETSARYYRPLEVESLLADTSKAREQLKWSPRITFRDLVAIMVDADLEANGVRSPGEGRKILETKLGQWHQWENSIAGSGASRRWSCHRMKETPEMGIGYWTDKRVVVTGGNGFLGSFVVKMLRKSGCREVLVPRTRDFDLRVHQDVDRLFSTTRPDVVLHLAAVVGGIGANRQHPGLFFYENAVMGLQVIEAARRHQVDKFVCLGTVCSYPKFTPTPFEENDLWNGYPEETNAPYGIAKKMLLVQLQSYREEYGFHGIYLLPVNLYGPCDNFDLESSHVIPALIRKCVEARDSGASKIVLWGTGRATREFLYVEDAAEAIVLAAERYDKPEPVNLGSGAEISIRDLVTQVKEMVGFTGSIDWDPSQPDGQPRRRLATDRAKREFDWCARTPLKEGLRKTIDWFTETYGITAGSRR